MFLDVYFSKRYSTVFDETGLSKGTPYPESPFFGEDRKAWSIFFSWKESGKYKTAQTDWGSWAILASKADLEEFFDLVYMGIDPEKMMSHMLKGRIALQDYIKECDPKTEYLICAMET